MRSFRSIFFMLRGALGHRIYIYAELLEYRVSAACFLRQSALYFVEPLAGFLVGAYYYARRFASQALIRVKLVALFREVGEVGRENAAHAYYAEYPYKLFGYLNALLRCGALYALVHQQQAAVGNGVAYRLKFLYLGGKAAGVYARLLLLREMREYKIGGAELAAFGGDGALKGLARDVFSEYTYILRTC